MQVPPQLIGISQLKWLHLSQHYKYWVKTWGCSSASYPMNTLGTNRSLKISQYQAFYTLGWKVTDKLHSFRSLVNLKWGILNCERKPECSEKRAHTRIGRTWKTHTQRPQLRVEPKNLITLNWFSTLIQRQIYCNLTVYLFD